MFTRNINIFLKLIFIMSATLGAAFLNFLLQVSYAKRLSIEDYGKLSLYLNFITLIMPLVGAGLPNFWIKISAKSENGLQEWIKPSTDFLKLTFLFSLLVQFLFCLIYVKSDFWIYWLLSTFIISQVSIDLINSVNIINNDTKKYMFWRIFSPCLRLTLFFLIVFLQKVTVANVAIIYLISAIIPFLKILGVIKGLSKSSTIKSIRVHSSLDVLRNCWMYSASGVLYLIYLQGNSIAIGYYYSLREVALFNIPILILTVMLMFPTIIFQKVFAVDLNKWFYTDKKKFIIFFNKANLYMVVIGIIFSAMFYFMAPIAVNIFFGKEFKDSVELVKIFSMLIPFAFLTSSLSSVHIKKRDLKVKVWIMSFVGIVHISLIYLLKDIFGIKLFAYTTVFSYILVNLLFIFSSKRILGKIE